MSYGLIQKRHHRSGYHVDWNLGQQKKINSHDREQAAAREIQSGSIAELQTNEKGYGGLVSFDSIQPVASTQTPDKDILEVEISKRAFRRLLKNDQNNQRVELTEPFSKPPLDRNSDPESDFKMLAIIFSALAVPLAFIFFPLGIMFGIIGLKYLKRVSTLDHQVSVLLKILAMAGIFLGILAGILAIFYLALYIWMFFVLA